MEAEVGSQVKGSRPTVCRMLADPAVRPAVAERRPAGNPAETAVRCAGTDAGPTAVSSQDDEQRMAG